MRDEAGRKKIIGAGEPVRGRGALSGLQVIADRLNDLPDLKTLAAGRDCDPVEKENCETWTIAETIVSDPSLSRASKTFNRHADNHPVTMVVEYPVMAIKKGATRPADRFIEQNTKPPRTGVSSRDAIGTVLWHLWLFYFQDRGWKRLKRCPISVCRKWFVDTSQNRRKARCSDACTNKWWNRYRRSGRTKPAPPSRVDRPATPAPLSRTELEKIMAKEARRDEVYMRRLRTSRNTSRARETKTTKGGTHGRTTHR